MRTFSIQTLGCKVNQYESEQIATLLRRRGLIQIDSTSADLRIVNTCSVTMQAASKSRQTVRRTIRLPVVEPDGAAEHHRRQGTRTIITGCWATSDTAGARKLGADAVLTHHDDLAARLNQLLDAWNHDCEITSTLTDNTLAKPPPMPLRDEGLMKQAGASAGLLNGDYTHAEPKRVKRNIRVIGTRSLPLLDARQDAHQRAFLKVQDGCDAHCSYCIIPQLRPTVWSKPIDGVVDEARRLVDAGHKEIVLTGIFLGAFGQPTAIRRRQPHDTGKPLGALVEALCTRVPGLRRLRFSSLEPGDLTPELLRVMKSHPQCVPHFHLPLQSGSDTILRKMNRQYLRGDFLQMIDRAHNAFDRPAITSDIIVGFPGETDEEFARTLEVVDRVKFIHIHAFHFSPRPGTAASRWTRDFVRGPVVNERNKILTNRAQQYSLAYRRTFLGQTLEVLVERDPGPSAGMRHGRCDRYFDVHFQGSAESGSLININVDCVTPSHTLGKQLRVGNVTPC